MAQRDLNLHRHGTGSSVTRRCPDKEMLGRYSFQLPDLPGGMRPLRAPDAADEG
ncbi:hypothetical protein ACF061_11700 [Streptomyces sp. NPDC015220]|uniref:hypothetical protein n=1 Tax=Streptomyces sp. NPDC015220 TaxID=3364947 RepID=UPI0036FAC4F5